MLHKSAALYGLVIFIILSRARSARCGIVAKLPILDSLSGFGLGRVLRDIFTSVNPVGVDIGGD